jgi:hypothetical protein
MKWIELDLDTYTFEGVDGEIHTFPGCSLVGFFEFENRLIELQSFLLAASDVMPVQSLYQSDRRFRWTIDRCLKLNGIDPSWCNWQIVEQMLFSPGLLREVNSPKSSGSTPGVSSPTLAELIAGIALSTGSLTEAIELAKSQPLNALVDIIEAQTKAQLPPEEQHQRGFEEWMENARNEAFGVQ